MDFKTMLTELKTRGKPVQVALPALGVVKVAISEVKDDVVVLERDDPQQKYFLHFSAVIVVT
jgi:hypothetical protein